MMRSTTTFTHLRFEMLDEQDLRPHEIDFAGYFNIEWRPTTHFGCACAHDYCRPSKESLKKIEDAVNNVRSDGALSGTEDGS